LQLQINDCSLTSTCFGCTFNATNLTLVDKGSSLDCSAVRIFIYNVTIEKDTLLSTTSRGYSSSSLSALKYSGNGKAVFYGSQSSYSGGSHGGLGGLADNLTYSYGEIALPTLPGSSGGSSSDNLGNESLQNTKTIVTSNVQFTNIL
jgi:hypothetical protein